MRKFLLGLIAVAAVFLPLSQNAPAHWVYYRKIYVYHHVYANHGCWHHGYWYAGSGTRVAGSILLGQTEGTVVSTQLSFRTFVLWLRFVDSLDLADEFGKVRVEVCLDQNFESFPDKSLELVFG